MRLVFGISMLAIVVATVGPLLLERLYRLRRPIKFSPDVDYKGAIVRVKPAFPSENVLQSLIIGFFLGVLAWGFGRLFVPILIFDVGFLEICFGVVFIISAVFFLVRGSFSAVKKGVITLIQRRAWLQAAKTAEALIIDRQVKEVVERGKKSLRFELFLKINGQLFRAVVSERIFRKYVKRDLLKVFYAVGTPEMFVVQGE